MSTTLTVIPSASESSETRRAISASHCSRPPPASIDNLTSEIDPSQRSRRCPSTRRRRSSRSALFRAVMSRNTAEMPGGLPGRLPDERERLGDLDLVPVLVERARCRVWGGACRRAPVPSALRRRSEDCRGPIRRHGFATDLVGAVTEQPFGTGVPGVEGAGEVHRHDGVLGRRHDGRQPRARLPFGSVGPSTSRITASVSGLFGHPERGETDVGGEFRPVESSGPQLGAGAHGPRAGGSGRRRAAGHVRPEPIGDQGVDGHPGERTGWVAEDRLGAGVGGHDESLGVGDEAASGIKPRTASISSAEPGSR